MNSQIAYRANLVRIDEMLTVAAERRRVLQRASRTADGSPPLDRSVRRGRPGLRLWLRLAR